MFVARNIVKVLSQKKVKFACMCTTGIVSTLYTYCAAGTIHPFVGVGKCCGTKEELLRNVLNNAESLDRWREIDVLFIDVISVLSKRTFDLLQYVSQNVRNCEYAFGGLHVVASVTFCSYAQLLMHWTRQAAKSCVLLGTTPR